MDIRQATFQYLDRENPPDFSHDPGGYGKNSQIHKVKCLPSQKYRRWKWQLEFQKNKGLCPAHYNLYTY